MNTSTIAVTVKDTTNKMYWYINTKILDVYTCTCVKYLLEKKTFIYDIDTSYKNSDRNYD